MADEPEEPDDDSVEPEDQGSETEDEGSAGARRRPDRGLRSRGARPLRKPLPDLGLGRSLERLHGGRRCGAALGAGHRAPALPVHRRARQRARADSPPVDPPRRGLRARHGPRPSRDRARPGRPRRLGRPVRARRAADLHACVAVPLQAEGIVVGLLALFFEQRAGRRRDARAAGCLPEPRGAGARPRAAIRAQDRRHAPRDRAADQPVRPLQGIRLDDRHRRALAAWSSARPSTSRPRRSRRSGCSTPTRARSRWPATAVNENYDVEAAGGRRRLGHRGRHRRSGGVPAQPDSRATTRSRRKTRGTR